LKSSSGGDSIIHRNNSHDCLDLIPKTALPNLFNFDRRTWWSPRDIKEIKTIIDLMKKNDLSVFEIEKEGFRLKTSKDVLRVRPRRSLGRLWQVSRKTAANNC